MLRVSTGLSGQKAHAASMTSLRARIVTLAASRALQPPDLEVSFAPVVKQIGVLARLAQTNPQAVIAAR